MFTTMLRLETADLWSSGLEKQALQGKLSAFVQTSSNTRRSSRVPGVCGV